MAIDTSRGRLERLARRSRQRAFWASVPPGAAARSRSGGRARTARGWVTGALVVVAGIAAYRLGPREIGLWVDEGVGRLDFAVGSRCEDVSRSYDRAIHTLGTASAASDRALLDRARLACESRAEQADSASRANACRASSSLYARAFDRRAAIASMAAVRPPVGGGIIGSSAAGVVAGDDVAEIEALARRMMAECAL